MNINNSFYLLLLSVLIQGCVAAGLAGIGTTAAVVHDTRTAGTVVEDQAIELKAAQVLYADKEIRKSSHINVTSYNTRVLITGETPSEELRMRIVEAIRNIEKVSHVYDELTIAAPSSLMSRSSDSLITSKVKTKLLTLKNFDGTRVKVVTERGIVYLMGLVTREEGERATAVTRQTGGVQKVVKVFQYLD